MELPVVVVIAVIAALTGILLCAVIVGFVVRRLGLPLREALMWFGLLELDVAMPPRAAERRRSQLQGASASGS